MLFAFNTDNKKALFCCLINPNVGSIINIEVNTTVGVKTSESSEVVS